MTSKRFLFGLFTVLWLSAAEASVPPEILNDARMLNVSRSLTSDTVQASQQPHSSGWWRIQGTNACKGPLLVEIWEVGGGPASSVASGDGTDDGFWDFCAELTSTETQGITASDKEACTLKLPYQRMLAPDPGQDTTWRVHLQNSLDTTVKYQIRASCTSPEPCPQPVLGSKKSCSGHGTCVISTASGAVCKCEAGWLGAGCQFKALPLTLKKQIAVRPSDAAGLKLPGAVAGNWLLYKVQVPAATFDADDDKPSLVVEMPVLWDPDTSNNNTILPGLCFGLQSKVFSSQGNFQPSRMSCAYGTGGKYKPAARATFPRDIMQGFSWIIQDPCAPCRGSEAIEECEGTCLKPQALYLLVRDAGSHPAQLTAWVSRSQTDIFNFVYAPPDDRCPYNCFASGSCVGSSQWYTCSTCDNRDVPPFLSGPARDEFCEGERTLYTGARLEQGSYFTPKFNSSIGYMPPRNELLVLQPATAYWWQLEPAAATTQELLLYLAEYRKGGVSWVHDGDLHITAYPGMTSSIGEADKAAPSFDSRMCWSTTASQIPVWMAGEKGFSIFRTSSQGDCSTHIRLLLQNFGSKSISFQLIASPSGNRKRTASRTGLTVGLASALVIVVIVGAIIYLMWRRSGHSQGGSGSQQPSAAAATAPRDLEMANGQTPATTLPGTDSTAAARPAGGLPLSIIQSFPVHAYSPLLTKKVAAVGATLPDVQLQTDTAVEAVVMNVMANTDAAAVPAHAADLEDCPWSSREPPSVSEHLKGRTTTIRRNPTANPLCAICLEEYVEGDLLRTLPCMHLFHKYCVDSWLASRTTCPVCRLGCHIS